VDYAMIVITLVSSAVALVGGSFLLLRTPHSMALYFAMSLFLMFGFALAFVPLITVVDTINTASLFCKISISMFGLALLSLLFLVLVFPYDFAIIASPLRKRIFLGTFILIAAAVVLGGMLIGNVRLMPDGSFWLDGNSQVFMITAAAIFFPATSVVDYLAYRTTGPARGASRMVAATMILTLLFFVIYVASGNMPSDWYWMDIGIMSPLAIIGYLIMAEKVDLVQPKREIMTTGAKSTYRLLEGRVYVVEEEKSHFSFTLFSEILRSRCPDCVSDESFLCESLECSKCSLPCPCKECELFKDRTQGLVVTRRHPSEIRMDYLIQTTPVIWLSSIPGKDNMDPSKLSLLTDIIVNFLENSSNGVVLVEGIEYLVTANDFQKVLRAVDRWSEAVMASSARLVISLSPKAFDQKELALIERNREVVTPGDSASIERILAESS
jgi:Protein of unknown function (DUF835)